MRRLVAVVLCCCALVPARVWAQPSCDELLIDGAGVVGDRAGEVTASADGLSRLGAEVRVRTVQSSGGDIDRYTAGLESGCPSWQSPDGGRRNNLVAIVVSIDERRTGIYYGSEWAPALDRWWLQVQAERMNPRFRDGDFAGGLRAGLDELARLVEARLRPPPPQAAPAPQPQDSPWVAPVPVPRPLPAPQPSNMPIAAFAVLGAIVLGAVAAVWGPKLVRARRRRRAARHAAIAARDAAAAAFVEMDDRWTRARDAAELLGPTLGRTDDDALDELEERARASCAEATDAHLRTAETLDDAAKLREDAYHVLEAGFDATAAAIGTALEAVGALESRIAELERLSRDLPGSMDEAGPAIAAARTLASTVASAGFRTERGERLLDEAVAAADRARGAFGARELTTAGEHAAHAADLISRATSWLATLERVRHDLGERCGALTERARSSGAAIDAARSDFETLSAEHAQSAWSSIAGNGSEAERRREQSLELLDRCREMLTMQRQEWDDARDGLERVTAWLDELDRLIGAIHSLKTNLDRARGAAPGEVEAALADADAAATFIAEHDADVSDELDHELAVARSVAARARDELRRDVPDYLQVVKLAREANAAADRILADARSEHDAMERARAAAASARRGAETAIRCAHDFIGNHPGDIGRRAHTLLDRAERTWDLAMASAVTEAADAFREAERLADDALDHARDDADRAREPSGWFMAGSDSGRSSWSSFGGSSDSSSSGSSFSSSSSGGGSSSWGRSGGGGGGSSGW